MQGNQVLRKIFFTGSVRGGRAQQPSYEIIVHELRKYGQVLSEHVADNRISHYGETELTAKEILDREKRMVNEADIIVADISTPSLGVGYLIACASEQKKKVIALYRGANTYKVSAIIKGDKHVSVYNYEYDDEIEGILNNVFQ